jgi:hypothetical protein
LQPLDLILIQKRLLQTQVCATMPQGPRRL